MERVATSVKTQPESVAVLRRAAELLDRKIGRGPLHGQGSLSRLLDELALGGGGTVSLEEFALAVRQARRELGVVATEGAALFEPPSGGK